jgi:putative membrane protein
VARRLSKDEQARIAEAIRESERRVGGEIVCVLAETAAMHGTALPVIVAAAAALALPWLLMATTRLAVQTMLLLQILAFLALLAAGAVPAVARWLTPSPVRRALAWRLAAEQFLVRGVSRTPNRTGILIFVARAERYARIIADEGIARHVPAAEWQAAVDALVSHMREDRPAEGFVAAIEICTTILIRHLPEVGAPDNVLADRIYEL